MAFILIPNHGEDIAINAWNWRPTLELLRAADLIDDDLCNRMGTNGIGTKIDAERANRIADFVEKTLRRLKPDDRIRGDLVVTNTPKIPFVISPGVGTNHIDLADAYSANYEWLTLFGHFCRESGGFRIS